MKIKTPGLTGKEWKERLERGGYRIGDYAEQLLLSKDFKSEKGEYEIAIVKGSDIDGKLTTENIRKYAKEKGYETPSPEIACIIRETISDEQIKEMGLWWITAMHEPIKDSGGDSSLLAVSRSGGGQWLNAVYDNPDYRWDREYGFAFVVPQVSSQNSDTKTSELSNLELRVENLENEQGNIRIRLDMLESPKRFTTSTDGMWNDLMITNKPKQYFYISSKGKVEKDTWNNGAKQNQRKEFGNYFETQQEALKIREKIEIYLKLPYYKK